MTDSITELTNAVKIESILKQRNELRSTKKPANKPQITVAIYNRQKCCWWCKQRRHTHFDCKQPNASALDAGKTEFTKDYHPTGNAEEAREAVIETPQSNNLLLEATHYALFKQHTDAGTFGSKLRTFVYKGEETLISIAESFGFRPNSRPSTAYLADRTPTMLPGNIRLFLSLGNAFTHILASRVGGEGYMGLSA